jgi:hypothetical protein
VEISHTNLSEVTGMVSVEIGSVVMLTTSHTTTTGVLAAVFKLVHRINWNSCTKCNALFADTTMTGRDMAAMLASFR